MDYVGTTQLEAVWLRFRSKRSGFAGLLVLSLMMLGVIVIPMVSPLTPSSFTRDESMWQVPMNLDPNMWYAPFLTTDPTSGQTYWLGTDRLGRDEFTRLFVAGRTTLFSALAVAIFTTIIGTLVGLVAGFYGGWVDTFFMRFTDLVLAWPLLPAYLITIKFLKDQLPRYTLTTQPAVILLLVTATFVAFNWMGVARLVRATLLSLRSQPFVEAAKALGAGSRHIVLKHLLPNSLAPILVAATLLVGEFILWEAVLAYFGQGISEPPIPSWGNLLAGVQDQIWFVNNPNPFEQIRFYLFLLPCMMILITILSVNALADALRGALVSNQE